MDEPPDQAQLGAITRAAMAAASNQDVIARDPGRLEQ
jgi:hypothetical protein